MRVAAQDPARQKRGCQGSASGQNPPATLDRSLAARSSRDRALPCGGRGRTPSPKRTPAACCREGSRNFLSERTGGNPYFVGEAVFGSRRLARGNRDTRAARLLVRSLGAVLADRSACTSGHGVRLRWPDSLLNAPRPPSRGPPTGPSRASPRRRSARLAERRRRD